MQVTLGLRICRIIKVFLATIVLIGICFGLIYDLDRAKRHLNQDLTSAMNNQDKTRFLSFLCAIVITIINILLRRVVRDMTAKEKQRTHTANNLSVAVKLALVRFVNTAIVPVIINVRSDRWFVDGGLVSDIFFIMISISFIDPIL